MRAMTIGEYGPPSVLSMQTLADPQCDVHDVLIEVQASSMNPVDYKIRSGAFRAPRELPIVPGYDCCGVVKESGSKVEHLHPGDEVYAFCHLFRDGAHAPLVAVDARSAALKPRSLDAVHAAALPIAAITAWEVIYDRLDVQAGQWVLIQAGAGGVGHLAIQLAKARGGHVIATASRDESIALCQQLGADVVINYKTEDVIERVKAETNDQGCTAALDAAGGEAFNQTLCCLAPEGRVATIVGTPPEAPLGELFLRNGTLHTVFIGAPNMYGYAPERHGHLLSEIAQMVDAGRLTPHVSATLNLDELVRAHELQETGHVLGKMAIAVQ